MVRLRPDVWMACAYHLGVCVGGGVWCCPQCQGHEDEWATQISWLPLLKWDGLKARAGKPPGIHWGGGVCLADTATTGPTQSITFATSWLSIGSVACADTFLMHT